MRHPTVISEFYGNFALFDNIPPTLFMGDAYSLIKAAQVIYIQRFMTCKFITATDVITAHMPPNGGVGVEFSIESPSWHLLGEG